METTNNFSFDSEVDLHSGYKNVSHQQQSFLGKDGIYRGALLCSSFLAQRRFYVWFRSRPNQGMQGLLL